MSKIMVFIGVIGSGKDYNANRLSEQGYARIDFKDGLLDLVSDVAGYNVRDEYDWFKEQIVGIRRPTNPLIEGFLNSATKELLSRSPELMTGRRLLTRLGTEGMRKRDEDCWVKLFVKSLDKALNNGQRVVTADCRFMNEVSAIREFSGAKFTFCDFHSHRYNPSLDHKSEMLAQALLSLGLKDGQEISLMDFDRAGEVLGRAA